MMSNQEADRQKAMAAVRAMFDKYKLLAAKRPEGHVVRSTRYCLLP
jgi:acyl-coenzyme A thioesterase 13